MISVFHEKNTKLKLNYLQLKSINSTFMLFEELGVISFEIFEKHIFLKMLKYHNGSHT